MLKDVEIFAAVAANNSFSKAARQLKLSAPVVTRHIAKLEKEIGVRLLQRNTRQVNLTEAGKLFYENCQNLISNYTAAINQAKDLSGDIVGSLKIGLPHSISDLLSQQHLKSFAERYPHLKIDIINGNHLIDLLSNGFDLVIYCGELTDSNFYSRKIGEWSKITCASPAYLKHYGIPKSPEDLAKHNCLDHYDNRTGSWFYQIKNEIKLINVSGNIRSNSSMNLKNLALAGLGLVYLPSFTVKNELKDKKLIPVLTDYQVPKLNIYAVYPSNQFLSNKAKLFMEFLMGLKIGD